jgi:hypothetical protein
VSVLVSLSPFLLLFLHLDPPPLLFLPLLLLLLFPPSLGLLALLLLDHGLPALLALCKHPPALHVGHRAPVQRQRRDALVVAHELGRRFSVPLVGRLFAAVAVAAVSAGPREGRVEKEKDAAVAGKVVVQNGNLKCSN